MPEIARSLNPRDFFRKRAVDEVSSMQMVEDVLSGVEREHMKVVPNLTTISKQKRPYIDFFR
ncbi:MAG: hypothetical protein IPM21_00080 [Acidobacteria bacterium]|nr:hypothetical protein [Acidobacteriota bacterium]